MNPASFALQASELENFVIHRDIIVTSYAERATRDGCKREFASRENTLHRFRRVHGTIFQEFSMSEFVGHMYQQYNRRVRNEVNLHKNKSLSPKGKELEKKRSVKIAQGWTRDSKGFLVVAPPKRIKEEEGWKTI